MNWFLLASLLVLPLLGYIAGRWHQQKLAAKHQLELRTKYDVAVQRFREIRKKELERLRAEAKDYEGLPWNEQMKVLGLRLKKGKPN